MSVSPTAPFLQGLPVPPPGKTGWPWTESSQVLPAKMPNGKPWTKISIVTPNYNQGQYIEETIRSVLLQGYPNLEYIIIDGGSTDNSLEIIKKYETFISYWVSESDRGQADAINKGFKQISGDIATFLNSDDTYLPNTLQTIALFADAHSDRDFFCGQLEFIDSHSSKIKGFAELFEVEINDFTMTETCHIAQQATFFKSSVFQQIGYLDESLHYCFDYEFWLRAFLADLKFTSIDEVLSQFRLHDSSKTNNAYDEGKFDRDFVNIYQNYLSEPKLSHSRRQGLRRGLAKATSLLFVHLEATKSTATARQALSNIIRQTPEVLLSTAIYPTLMVALTPTPIRQAWRNLKRK